MRILFAGAGAMGARFGYLLNQTGNDVVFADHWQEHIDAINRKGLQMIVDNVDQGNAMIPAMLPQEVEGEFDVVFAFTKAMQLDSMLQDIQHVIKENTKIICLLNGLGHVEVLKKYIDPKNIYLGMTIWSSGLSGPGVVDAVGSGAIELQQLQATEDTIHQTLLDVLNEAGLHVSFSSDVLNAIWHKVCLNCVLNSYCTLIDCNIAEYGRYSDHRILTDLVVGEVSAVAEAEGYRLDRQWIIDNIEATFDEATLGKHHPSLYQDMAKKRKTEIDYLNGAVAGLGAQHGIATPVCLAITHMIHAKESVIGAK